MRKNMDYINKLILINLLLIRACRCYKIHKQLIIKENLMKED